MAAVALASWRMLGPGDSSQLLPTIAVLAFDNLSEDPAQEYFSDGLAEDLITRLAAFRGLTVIARNSSFVYKGRAVDARQVSAELGARYLVEGSVRRADSRIRISVQLIDGPSGYHVWAQTYDREIGDLFALQHEMSRSIVAELQPQLKQTEMERAMRRDPANVGALDSLYRGSGASPGSTQRTTRGRARASSARSSWIPAGARPTPVWP